MSEHKHHNITAVILAGGESRRMGENKAFSLLNGRPLIAHVYEILNAQCSQIMISSNDHIGLDKALPHDTHYIRDRVHPSRGPLEGILSALQFRTEYADDWLLSSPVDCPLIPKNLAEQLIAQVNNDEKIDCAFASYKKRGHYLSAIWRPSIRHTLEDHLAKGPYDVRSFLNKLNAIEVDFSECSVDPFININTQADLEYVASLSSETSKGH
jgi:molybdopterin-guanine dinucleotide biosynthesis protein A